MSSLQPPNNAFYFSSIIYSSLYFEQQDIMRLWTARFGDRYSFIIPEYNPSFPYYAKEMGDEAHLQRIIILCSVLRPVEEMVGHKVWTTQIEKSHSLRGLRRINWDMGILTAESIHLATGKNFIHRQHLELGVFLDLNFTYQNGSFRPTPWAYPDYTESAKLSFFHEQRKLLLSLRSNSQTGV